MQCRLSTSVAVGGLTGNGMFLVIPRDEDLSTNIGGVALASGSLCSSDFLQLQALHQAALGFLS